MLRMGPLPLPQGERGFGSRYYPLAEHESLIAKYLTASDWSTRGRIAALNWEVSLAEEIADDRSFDEPPCRPLSRRPGHLGPRRDHHARLQIARGAGAARRRAGARWRRLVHRPAARPSRLARSQAWPGRDR